VLVCQLEIPLEPTLAALRLARAAGVRTVFNPAPARLDLPGDVYPLSDVFCPNEGEAALLTGLPVDTDAQAEAAARALLVRGAGSVVLTLGARGSLVVTPDGLTRVAAERVKAVDSTGAGDAYVGSLAYLLGAGLELPEAARRAGAIATRSVLKPGTQTSFPSREEVAGLLP
jgi:ribokinase